MSSTVADLEPALNVHFNYGTRPDGTQFFAPDAEPSLDLDVPVAHIGGLQNFLLPRSAGGSGPNGTYWGSDYRHAYAPGTLLSGAGQSVGIVMADGFAQADIDQYASSVGLSFSPVQTVPANSGTTPGAEATLDIDMVLSMAPNAQVVAFTTAVSDFGAVLANAAARPDVKQITSSWTWYNGTYADAALMAELAMQGQTFFQITGDCAAAAPPAFANTADGTFDARQLPFATLVGGTSLNMSNSGASYGTEETVWSVPSGCSICGGVCGSTGAIESNSLISGRWNPSSPDADIWSNGLPAYQASIGGLNGASSTNRNIPDVSAQAAGGEIILGGNQVNYQGTSQASPLWAGFMALVNQEAAAYGVGSIGFANPALYAIAASSAYGTTFHDVVTGNNVNGSGFAYYAGPGYDLTTGLGSPQLALIDALVSYGEPGFSASGNTDNGVAPGSGTITGVNGLCVDLYDLNTTNGTAVQVFTCGAGKTNQNWVLTRQGAIVGRGGGCLEIPDFNTSPGTHLDFWTCNGGINQVWHALPNGTIQGENGVCLTASGTTAGSALEVEPCAAGQATQQWVINGAAEIARPEPVHRAAGLRLGERHRRRLLQLQWGSEPGVDLDPAGRNHRDGREVPRAPRLPDGGRNADRLLDLQRRREPGVDAGAERQHPRSTAGSASIYPTSRRRTGPASTTGIATDRRTRAGSTRCPPSP